jgi:hypothetical protein
VEGFFLKEKAMTKIIVDDALLAKLQNLKDTIHLCDGAGKIVGIVNPVLDPDEYGPLEPQITKEEADRRFNEEKRYSTAEVLARLEKL